MSVRAIPLAARGHVQRQVGGAVGGEALRDAVAAPCMLREIFCGRRALAACSTGRAGKGLQATPGAPPRYPSQLQAHAAPDASYPGIASTSEQPTGVDSSGTHLQDLHVQDFALVREQHVTFARGLNVVTGASGAGKSVLVQALGQVLGAPVIDDCIRSGAQKAIVEGRFAISPALSGALTQMLASLGLPKKAIWGGAGSSKLTELRVRREVSVSPSGTRSRCFINGAATSVRVVRELGSILVDVNGQNSAQTIRDPSTQLALLDRIAGTLHMASRFSQKLEKLRKLQRQLEDLEELGMEGEREALQSLCDKVDGLGITAGEEVQLRSKLRVMEARRVAVQQCGIVNTMLSGDGTGGGGVADALHDAASQLRQLISQEQRNRDDLRRSKDSGEEGTTGGGNQSDSGTRALEAALASLELADENVDEAGQQVHAYAEEFEFDEYEHQEMRTRLRAVEAAMRDCECTSTEEVLEKVEDAAQKLDRWFQMEGSQEQWEQEVVCLSGELESEACELSRLRRGAAGRLRAAVERCLGQLAMATSRFDVRVCWEPESKPHAAALHVSEAKASELGEGRDARYRVTSTGLDVVEFMLAAGPAEPLRPLSAVASGGETSRLMLALKTAPVELAIADKERLDHSDEGRAPSDAREEGCLSIEREDGGETLLNLEGEGDGLFDNEDAVEDAKGSGAPVVILDELDSSVGGRLGASVGQLLQRLASPDATSAASQVICISHLPQVAAHANHHVRVRKTAGDDGRVVTAFDVLSRPEDRASEVADMLGVGVASPAALDLLRSAQGWSQEGLDDVAKEAQATNGQ